MYKMTVSNENLQQIKKNANISNRYNQAPFLTRGIIRGGDKSTRKHHTQESSEASAFPAGDNKAAMNRQDNITKTNV